MKVILKRDEFNELNKEYEVHHIEEDKYGNKRIYLSENRWVAPSLVEKYIEGENMKTTIYELLGMIKDGKAPKIILFRGLQYEFDDVMNDYVSNNNNWLFDEYVITDILNDEVQILETTITYKSDKIEKLDYIHPDISCSYNESELLLRIEANKNKINKIIDRLNGE